MPRMVGTGLSRREREILDLLYAHPGMSVSEVLAELESPPSYSAVRSTLRILEEKGYARHEVKGKVYLYRPTESPRVVARSAIRRVIHTFFGGNLGDAVQTFLSDAETRLSDQELDELVRIVRDAKKQESGR